MSKSFRRGPHKLFLWPTLLLLIGTIAIAGGTAQVEQEQQIRGGNGITLPSSPGTAVKPVTDDYFGTSIVDNYRWLEDAKSAETRAWIDEENSFTQQYLSQVSLRPQIVRRLTQLQRVDVSDIPLLRGQKYFFAKRLADENQASIYVRDGWKGNDERLVDATRLSTDQNSSLSIEDVSDDGRLLVYGVRQGGADEESLHFLDVTTGKELVDTLPSARYFEVSLSPNNKSLYYSRFAPSGTTVWLHKLGDDRGKDERIFGGEYRGEKLDELALIGAGVSGDKHYLVIEIAHGVPATRNDFLIEDLRRPANGLVALVYGVQAHTRMVEADDRFFLMTDYQAPSGRIAEVKPGEEPAQWKTLVESGQNVIDDFGIVGGRIFVSRLNHVKTETTIYNLDGVKISELRYPGIGSGTIVFGRPTQNLGFYTFQSFIMPPTIYRYDVKTARSDVFARPKVPFDTAEFVVSQVFYTSKDGTRVPMFIAGRKGLARDGTARLLMTGYGGFDAAMTPVFDAEYAWWIEQGGFFALPNLRGGDEYGERWHEAGMFEHKQNVFDDWFGAAEYLIENKYTSPAHFAIRGRSNGGLLMGASMTQRPDLFAAIWCGYPLLDMLRYQKFEFGRLWTTEYGSAENAKDFPYLLKYSPYQNVKPGIKYPAIMFFTGDSDTRVDPLHARKMAALMQASNGGGRPIVLHYSLKGGHSAGVSLTQLVEDQADEMVFLWNETRRN
jgi:prolyl oligopeptidase